MSKVALDNLLERRYRTRGLSKVVDYLSSMSRRSKRTAISYSFALDHFDDFVNKQYNNKKYNIQTILVPLKKQSIDIYTLLDQFIKYLLKDAPNAKDLSPKSIHIYMTAVRSYLSYNDIDILPTKFRHRVKMPSVYREDEQALDAKDIREILLACNNRRLKAYLLVLASGGMRAIEALAIRLQDLDFTAASPTKVHIRKESEKQIDLYRKDKFAFIEGAFSKRLAELEDNQAILRNIITNNADKPEAQIKAVVALNETTALLINLFESLPSICNLSADAFGNSSTSDNIVNNNNNSITAVIANNNNNKSWFCKQGCNRMHTKGTDDCPHWAV